MKSENNIYDETQKKRITSSPWVMALNWQPWRLTMVEVSAGQLMSAVCQGGNIEGKCPRACREEFYGRAICPRRMSKITSGECPRKMVWCTRRFLELKCSGNLFGINVYDLVNTHTHTRIQADR